MGNTPMASTATKKGTKQSKKFFIFMTPFWANAVEAKMVRTKAASGMKRFLI
jgi:hypothetical protein